MDDLISKIASGFMVLLLTKLLNYIGTVYKSDAVKMVNNEYGTILATYIANDVFPSKERLQSLKKDLTKKYNVSLRDFDSTDQILAFAYCSFLSNQHSTLKDKALFETRFTRNKSHFIVQDTFIPTSKWYYIKKKTFFNEALEFLLLSSFFIVFFMISFFVNGQSLNKELLILTISVSLGMGGVSYVSGIILGKFLSPKKTKY